MFDRILANLTRYVLPTEQEVESIVDMVCEILIKEPTVLNLRTPINIIGDIHGQFADLQELFGSLQSHKILLLGDYVDRGLHSVETILYLLTLKVLFPESVYLIRGNHESRGLTKIYGFYDEVLEKYGRSHRVWSLIQYTFDLFPLAAIIDGRFFCVHGGLSPHALTIDKIKGMDRSGESGIITDMLWADPGDVGWAKSQRGTGFLYGSDITSAFLEVNDFKKIIRSHQMVEEGFKFHFDFKGVVTVWSARDYCGRCANDASALVLNETHSVEPSDFIILQSNMKRF